MFPMYPHLVYSMYFHCVATGWFQTRNKICFIPTRRTGALYHAQISRQKNLHPFTRNSRSRSVFSFPVIDFQRGDDPYPRLREFLSKVCEFIFLFLFRAVALPNIHSSLYLLFLRAVSKTASSRKERIVALASPTNLGSCWILNA